MMDDALLICKQTQDKGSHVFEFTGNLMTLDLRADFYRVVQWCQQNLAAHTWTYEVIPTRGVALSFDSTGNYVVPPQVMNAVLTVRVHWDAEAMQLQLVLDDFAVKG